MNEKKEKIYGKTTTKWTKYKKIDKFKKTRIFTFIPTDFEVEDEETEVLHMYIIAKLLKIL